MTRPRQLGRDGTTNTYPVLVSSPIAAARLRSSSASTRPPEREFSQEPVHAVAFRQLVGQQRQFERGGSVIGNGGHRVAMWVENREASMR